MSQNAINKDNILWSPPHNGETNIEHCLQSFKLKDYEQLHQYSISHKADFWQYVLTQLEIVFTKKPTAIIGTPSDVKHPDWLMGSELNIAASCFTAPSEKIALFIGNEAGEITHYSYQQLLADVQQFAGSLHHHEIEVGEVITLYLPLSYQAVVSYLGLIYGGFVPALVADSFSTEELDKRMAIVGSTILISQQQYIYNNKTIPLGKKAAASAAITKLIIGDNYEDFISQGEPLPQPFKCSPSTMASILFSSGTTSTPKAIPWTHTTPIKCGMDGHFHFDIKNSDTITWTTGMGWMMAPWLIFAGLLNNATVALFTGSAAHANYPKFLQQSNTTILGTIPSLVKVWKHNKLLENQTLDIRILGSTGEPSNAIDYSYLMGLFNNGAPIIEYCGGTEIGGGYITGTLVHDCIPTTFTTPALGLDFLLLNEQQQPSLTGQVYLVPPSIGLSETILNKDHDSVYYKDAPIINGLLLRQHGDAYETFTHNNTTYYKCLGRTDDSMNLGGIKVSAIEIETVVNTLDNIHECAAFSKRKTVDGPELLILSVVPKKLGESVDLVAINQLIRTKINPLFKVVALELRESLPRTASNKIMRRILKENYALE